MLKWIGVLSAAALLPACATRGTLDVECGDLALTRLTPSQLVRDIQSGASEADPTAIAPGEERIDASGKVLPLSAEADKALAAAFLGSEGVRHSLLLSGGGQWGSYGAGFLAALQERRRLPAFATVTGVSTGGLQSLFVGALGDPALSDAERDEIMRTLMRSYRPAAETEIVNRHGWKGFAVVSGSFAGLKPLRERIYGRLCNDGRRPTDCPVIRHLAQSDTEVFIGFVGARDGAFYYSNITEIAKRAYPARGVVPQPAVLRSAQQCIAGAALASAAMPVFFQQVRIGSGTSWTTYYDGGVRQSVFEINAAERMNGAIAALKNANPALMNKSSAELPALYVIRNGPTVLIRNKDDSDFDQKGSAIDAALRAQTILVNQLEVQSIADLRLAHPKGDIWLRTADGFDREHPHPGDVAMSPPLPHVIDYAGREGPCVKDPKQAMFSPSFMGCLMRYGREHGSKASWIRLSELDLKTKAEAGR